MALTVRGRHNPDEGMFRTEPEIAEKLGLVRQGVSAATRHAIRMLWRMSVMPEEEFENRKRQVLRLRKQEKGLR